VASSEHRQEQLPRLGFYRCLLALFGMLVAGVVVIDRWFWIIRIAGSSMVPTMTEGDIVVALKRRGARASLQRNDIVVARPSKGAGLIVKRVIGLPGELVAWDANSVRLDDGSAGPLGLAPEGVGASYKCRIQIPDHHYFLVGDNTSHTADSRVFGAVPIGLVEGRVWFRLWPVNPNDWLLVQTPRGLIGGRGIFRRGTMGFPKLLASVIETVPAFRRRGHGDTPVS
jgi:inner membrane protease subunit 1